MIRLFVALWLSLLTIPALAKYPTSSEFSTHVIPTQALGPITWHVDTVNDQARGPLIVWLPGSGAFPYFQRFADGGIGFMFPLTLLEYRDRAHFLVVDKPGVPFEADVGFDEKRGRPIELDNTVYREGLTKDQLVARTGAAIKVARKQLGSRITELIVIGGSEGGQYAFALGRRVRADKVVVWGGIALPQYFDLVLEQRLAAERGEITRDKAQANVEQLFRDIRSVQNSPNDIVARFQGETNRRWAGFGPYAAIDDMLALDIPLLMVQGGNDSNAPIINSDFAMVAFLSRGKSNLDYWVYPNSDHSFRLSDGKGIESVSIEKEIWIRVWQWIAPSQSSLTAKQ